MSIPVRNAGQSRRLVLQGHFLKQTGEGRTKAVIIKTYDQLFDAEDKEADHV